MLSLLVLLLVGFSFSDVVEDILKLNPFSQDRRYVPGGKESGGNKTGSRGKTASLPSELVIGGYVSEGGKKYVLLYRSNKFELVRIGSDLGGYRLVDVKDNYALIEFQGKRKRIKLKYVKLKSSPLKGKLPPPPGRRRR